MRGTERTIPAAVQLPDRVRMYAAGMAEPAGESPVRGLLSRRRILEAALELVDREGAAALSMRRLASELGAGTMSLYNHVPGRDGVLDGLSEVMVARIGVPSDTGDWEESLGRLMRGIRAVARAHPDAFLLVGMRPLNTRQALPPIEAVLRAMRAAGFDRETASYAYRLAVAYARGFALAEIGGFTLDAPGERLRALDLEPEEFPHIVDLAPCLSPVDRDAVFEFGVETILDGLRPRRPNRPEATG